MSRAVVVASVAAALLYAVSAPEGAYWGDSAQMSERALTLRLDVGERSYPLQRALAWAVSRLVGDPATGSAAISWIAGGAAVGATFALARRLTGDTLAAAAAAAALTFSPPFWGHAEVAEVYALLGLLVAGGLFVALGPPGRRGDLLLGALLGASLLHHRVGVLVWAVALVGRLAGSPPGSRGRAAARVLAAAAVAAVPFAVLAFVGDGSLLEARTGTALLEPGGGSLGRAVAATARWAAYAASPFVLVAAIAGLRRLPRAEAIALGGTVAVALAVPVWLGARGDVVVLGIAALPALAVLAAAAVGRPWPRAARLRLPAAVLVGLGSLLSALTLTATGAAERLFPAYTPSTARGMLLPVLGDLEPEAHARGVLTALPEGAAVRADWGVGRLLRFVQTARGVRPDVRVVTGTLTNARPGEFVAVTPIFRDPRSRVGAVSGTLRELHPAVYVVESGDD